MFKKRSKLQFNKNTIEDPIRDEIYSSERLNDYGIFLSKELHVHMNLKKCHNFLSRIKENEKYLNESYNKISNYIANDIPLSPGAEWILDNFHIIQDQIREIKEDLPQKFYLELPQIKEGELAGYPRVYAIALTLTAHLDSSIDIHMVKEFINNYQHHTPLFIGEIWAIPIMLRIALLENLRRLAIQIVICQDTKNHVNNLAKDIFQVKSPTLKTVDKFPHQINKILGVSEISDLSAISQLSQSLHVRSSEELPIFEKIKDSLNQNNYNIEEYTKKEHILQALTQVTVSNIISSMKRLSNTDWHIFFEDLSLVDRELSKDPLDIYKRMDFKTRDQYRKSIELLHKRTRFGEIELAKKVLSLANLAKKINETDKRKHHVGFYLIGNGLSQLKSEINYHNNIIEKIVKFITQNSFQFYISFLLVLTILLILPISFYTYWTTSSILWSFFITLLSLIPASDSALNILDLLVTFLVKPNLLPKIDLKNGIPNHAKTFVIIPMIFCNKEEVDKAIADIEIRYLGNQDKNLYYALLSDLQDSNTKYHSDDQAIINCLKEGIKRLNDKYEVSIPHFFLFNRNRKWNSNENKWMGWERKRGKIHEFNCFLQNKEHTSFNIKPNLFNII
jgi:cyclic beta-1,2-glucan synthetase